MPKFKLLIVDDNVDGADSLAMLLEAVGHSAVAIYRGREAITAAAAGSFDAILLDIGLPDLDGYEVIKRIHEQNADQIVIAVSGYGQAKDVHKAMSCGFSHHLIKPVALEELESTLNGLLHSANA